MVAAPERLQRPVADIRADRPIADIDAQCKDPRVRIRTRLAVAALLGATLAEGLWHRGALLDPISPWLKAVSLILGFGSGFLLALFIEKSWERKIDFRAAVALCGIPFLTMMLFTYVARRGVETWAFWHFVPREENLTAHVTSTSLRRTPLVRVRASPEGRDVLVYVTAAARDAVKARRDCMRLVVQYGRADIARTRLPNVFDPPKEQKDFFPCKGEPNGS